MAILMGWASLQAEAGAATASQRSPPEPAASAPHPSGERTGESCSRLVPAVWPTGAISRRLQIARLQIYRPSCLDNADYLAALGGLILEDGDPEQALIWLERSLLLDPENRGAQVDHALALSELGQPEALHALVEDWRGRTDLPPALRNKLYPPDAAALYGFPGVRLGAQPVASNWGTQGEISLLLGRDNNLDRSPQLTELSLTIPDGPFVLPVDSRPHAGFAAIAGTALQIAYAPLRSTILRAGFNLTDRSAKDQHSTDWRQIQWAASASHQLGWLRGQIEASTAWVGGPLSEAYRLSRVGANLEAAAAECRLRVAYDSERRVQSVTATFNARADGWQGSLQCPLPGAPSFNLAVYARAGHDRPAAVDSRPGGYQRLQAGGLRLVGPVGASTRMELTLRRSRSQDSEGYSPLLADNAIRQSMLHQTSIELWRPLDLMGWTGLEATLQYVNARQTSNLPIFVYRAESWYGGVRWAW